MTNFTNLPRSRVKVVGPSITLGNFYLSINDSNYINIGNNLHLIISEGRIATPWLNVAKT